MGGARGGLNRNKRHSRLWLWQMSFGKRLGAAVTGYRAAQTRQRTRLASRRAAFFSFLIFSGVRWFSRMFDHLLVRELHLNECLHRTRCQGFKCNCNKAQKNPLTIKFTKINQFQIRLGAAAATRSCLLSFHSDSPHRAHSGVWHLWIHSTAASNLTLKQILW